MTPFQTPSDHCSSVSFCSLHCVFSPVGFTWEKMCHNDETMKNDFRTILSESAVSYVGKILVID